MFQAAIKICGMIKVNGNHKESEWWNREIKAKSEQRNEHGRNSKKRKIKKSG